MCCLAIPGLLLGVFLGCSRDVAAWHDSGAVSWFVAWIVAGSDAWLFCEDVMIPGPLLGTSLGAFLSCSI